MSNSGHDCLASRCISSSPHPEVLPPTWSGGASKDAGLAPEQSSFEAPRQSAEHLSIRLSVLAARFFCARVLPVTTKPRSNSERTIEAVSSTKRHLSTRFQQLKESGTPADALCCCPHTSGVRDAPRSKAACAAPRLRAR